ncbi:MAG: 50S ribosomal protein L23 [Candidatus Thermoplasmatota archaeon]|jgi:large subunit ribosomal protein L23|nr:50S ribosomal protein L23 [Thermoplasmata archaeon]
MTVDPYDILLHPYVTEKTMNFLEGTPAQNQKDGNRLEFIVRRDATKPQIREAFEKLFDVKVEKVNTLIRKDGKHAIIKLRKEFRAEDVALRIGVY